MKNITELPEDFLNEVLSQLNRLDNIQNQAKKRIATAGISNKQYMVLQRKYLQAHTELNNVILFLNKLGLHPIKTSSREGYYFYQGDKNG